MALPSIPVVYSRGIIQHSGQILPSYRMTLIEKKGWDLPLLLSGLISLHVLAVQFPQPIDSV